MAENTRNQTAAQDRQEEGLPEEEIRLADMSLLEDRGLGERWFGQRRLPGLKTQERESGRGAAEPRELLQGAERRTAIRGALAASLLIGLVYVAAAGLLILFLLWIWGAL